MAPTKRAPAEEPTPEAVAEPTVEVNPDGPPPADDIPVFAPAEEPTPEAVAEVQIPSWLADNYRELIADPNRNDSFTKLAARSEGDLAAWARQEAAKAGEDITPVDAEAAGADSTRESAEQ